jgi:PPM family protein phosphatase
MIVDLYAKTDVGRVREGNEDNFLLLDLSSALSFTYTESEEFPKELGRFDLGDRGLVLVVSDGMGGALAGDVASRMAVETVRDLLLAGEIDPTSQLLPRVEQAILDVNRAIHHKSIVDIECSGMGATFTCAAIIDNTAYFLQVGDSRAYMIRGEQIELVTKDQSLVQQLVDVGKITREEAETHIFRNVILQALGAHNEVAPVVSRTRLSNGDILLLCSDGLSGKLRAEEMLDIIISTGSNLELACEKLIDEANRRGGEDNITVVLAHFAGDGLEDSSSDSIEVEEVAQ